MLPLGHMGVTLGAVALARNLATKRGANSTKAKAEALAAATSNPGPSAASASYDSPVDWLMPWSKQIDYRILLLGSMLPDFLDKPVGLLVFSDFFSNGRIFSHTILFFLLLGIAGIYLYSRWGKTYLLVLALGSGLHLVFDYMWTDPKTLFWPFFGLAFRRADYGNWLWRVLNRLLNDPASYVPEAIGAVILIMVAVRLIRLKKVKLFLRTGQAD